MPRSERMTAWFENCEIGVSSNHGARPLSEWVRESVSWFRFEFEAGEVSRVPSADEVVIQLDLF